MTLVRPVLFRQIVVALTLALCASLITATPAEAVDNRTNAQIRDRIEYLVNRERARHGLPKLRVNKKLQRGARRHSRDMASRRSIYHDPNLNNEVPRRASAWGENVARTTSRDAARHAMNMFMQSSGHRRNILLQRWSHMGIGVRKRGKYTYVTQRFADL